MSVKIAAVGVAFPRLRLANDEVKAAWGTAPRDIDERTVPSFDEDCFTLAVEAGRRALAAAGVAARDVKTIVTTFGDPAVFPSIAEALGAHGAERVVLAPCHGPQLVAALGALPAPTLAVAASVQDASPGSPNDAVQGAGAVAFVLGAAGAAVPPDAPVAPWRKITGDLGVAQGWLDLVGALREAKANVPGLDVEAALARGKRVTYGRALQERRVMAEHDPLPDQPMGAFVPMGTFEASIPARWRLEGARCGACGRAFLPAPAKCLECGGAVAAHAFPWKGSVYASTVIGRGGAPSEFAEQQRQTGEYPVAVVELDGGARTVAQVTDADAAVLIIGTAIEPVLRRLYKQQGTVRYGLKWRPLG